jgi:hypothetical protein
MSLEQIKCKFINKDSRDIIIKNMFPKTIDNDYCKDSKVLIFTNNRNKVEEYMGRFDNFSTRRVSKDYIEFETTDGTRYKWIKLTESSRGNKCKYAVIDRDLDIHSEAFQCVLMPCCLFVSQETLEII